MTTIFVKLATISMKRFLIFTITCLFSISTSMAQFSSSLKAKDAKVDVKLTKDTVAIGSAIPIIITITNTSKTDKKLLLDKPHAIGSPWGVWASIINLKNKQQATMYQSRAVFSSVIYTEDKLKDSYYTVKPGESISAGYDLLDVVMVSYRERYLPKGDYELQLTYYNSTSKKVRFTVI
jgi:hypothetical protein